MNLASFRPAKAELRNWVAAGINRNRDGRERRAADSGGSIEAFTPRRRARGIISPRRGLRPDR